MSDEVGPFFHKILIAFIIMNFALVIIVVVVKKTTLLDAKFTCEVWQAEETNIFTLI